MSSSVVRSDIEYARSSGVAIAYQVVGEGDVDLVFVPDSGSNLVYGWEYPLWREFYERLARSFRLILFDKRSTGLSDHGGQFATLETRMEDLRAVLDAVGSSNAVVFGAHEGCGMAALFAATYPERTGRWRCSIRGSAAARREARREELDRAPRALGNAGVLGRAPPRGLPDAVRETKTIAGGSPITNESA